MPEFEIPELPAVIFGSAQHWPTNAHLNQSAEDWDVYADGYRKAAELIAASVAEDPIHVDYCVYPLVFLYRHYLELRLKQILRRGGYLLDEEPVFPKNHDLIDLWKRARGYLKRIWPDSDELQDLDKVITAFAMIDPVSFAFRYPVTKKGEPSVPAFNTINILQVAQAIASIGPTLDGSCYGIEEYRDTKAEIEAEYAAEAAYEEAAEFEGDYEHGDYEGYEQEW